MIPIIYSGGITLAFAVFNFLSQRVVKAWVYIVLFLSLFVASYLIETKLSAETIRGPFEHEIVMTERGISLVRGYEAKVAYHKRRAAECFCDAEDMCMWLPDDKKQIAYAILEGVVEASAATYMGSWAGLIADAIVQMTKYGIFCCQQADKIKAKLEEAEWHYNMACYYFNKG